jgi:hypothetical protein
MISCGFEPVGKVVPILTAEDKLFVAAADTSLASDPACQAKNPPWEGNIGDIGVVSMLPP